jgi:hypothetical protein
MFDGLSCNLLFVGGGHTAEAAKAYLLGMKPMAIMKLITDSSLMTYRWKKWQQFGKWQELQGKGIVQELQVVGDVFAQCVEPDSTMGGYKECAHNPNTAWVDSSIAV